ncbi:MAG: hypothetical protein AAGA45_03470 [Verrucomicrobiota bacterium]
MSTETGVKEVACAKCIYWNKTSDAEGECRRNAPQSVVFAVDEDTQFETRFPVTASTDWCGEFKA